MSRSKNYEQQFLTVWKKTTSYLNKFDSKQFNYFVEKFKKWLKVSTKEQMQKYIDNLHRDEEIQNKVNLKKFIVCVTEYSVKKAVSSM